MDKLSGDVKDTWPTKILHQIFVPVDVPVGTSPASIFVEAMNQVSREACLDTAKKYPGMPIQLCIRQVIVLPGILQQNFILLIDVIGGV